jgi:hypothetical protein
MACSLGGASSLISNGRIYIGPLPLHAPRNDPAQNRGVGIAALYYAYHVQCLRTAARWLKWSRRLRRVQGLRCTMPCGRQRGRAMLGAKSKRRPRLLLLGAFASVGMWRAGPRGGGCGLKRRTMNGTAASLAPMRPPRVQHGRPAEAYRQGHERCCTGAGRLACLSDVSCS